MDISQITDVTRHVGIISPQGTRYVPESEAELDAVKSRIISYGTTGVVGHAGQIRVSVTRDISGGIVGIRSTWATTRATCPATESMNVASYDFISFRHSGEVFYIDMHTVRQEIRSRRIEQATNE